MATKLLLAGILTIGFLALTPAASATSAGFCTMGICAGVNYVSVTPTYASAYVCSNVVLGCQGTTVPIPSPPGPLPAGVPPIACLPGVGSPDGTTVVVVCL